MDHLTGALKWYDAGCSVVPVVADGSKRPLGTWKDYQVTRAPRERVEKWFKTTPEQGVGLICGAVSGGLEMLEIEAVRMGGEYWDKIDEAMKANGVHSEWTWLIDNGYTETTPSGGIHILYRINNDTPVPGNTKIALDVTGKITYAETRGEGGFVVVAPSSGTVHKTGESWAVASGKIGEIGQISWDVRCLIHTALREALDERTMPIYERPAGMVAYDRSQGDRPGDAFNDDPSVTIHDILLRNGWKYLGKSRGQDKYVHPLSSDMTTQSACTGHKGSPNLYVWSGMSREDYYTKFGVLVELEFNGDFSEASRWLRSQGYGSERELLDISDWFEQETSDEASRMGADVESTTPAVASVVEDPTASVRLREWTETGVGELLAKVYGKKFRNVHDQKAWRVYKDGLWSLDQERQVEFAAKRITKILLDQAGEMISEAEGDEEKVKIANSVYRKAESFRSDRGAKAVVNRFGAERGITVPFEAFDPYLNLIRFANGTLDLDTLTLREHRPEDMITMDVPYAYDPSATAPMFSKFLEESLPDDDVRGYIQRASGYTLSGTPNEGVWFALYGDTGCGKSTWLNIVKASMGDHARTAAQATFAQRNEGSRAANDLQDIRNCRMVSISETKEGQLFNEALIKQYSGGDEMNSHGLYQNNGTWKNRGVLFMATNHPPRLSADDNANWRRVKMIEFPVSQYTNPNMNPDPKLADKIIASELPGVMNWIIDGLRDYRAHGLGEPKAVTVAVKNHRTEVDPVAQFLSEGMADGYIRVDHDDDNMQIPANQLHRIFSNWCIENGYKPFAPRRFGMRLTALRFSQRRNSTTRFWVGIGQGTRGILGTF